jgi:hypothetical protein
MTELKFESHDQELSIEQLQAVSGGWNPFAWLFRESQKRNLKEGAKVVRGLSSLNKHVRDEIGAGDCSANSDCRDSSSDSNKLSFYTMREETTLIV